jgi:hypothetical protein
MLERLSEWLKRVNFPEVAAVPLGSGAEYWDSDPRHYEGWEQLRDRLEALGRKSTNSGLAYELASHRLDDVIVAAGGVERAITKLREAIAELKEYASDYGIEAKNGIPHGLVHEAATEALYAFSDVLSWSRTVVERLERSPRDGKKFSKQGLVPALKPKRLRKRCEKLLIQLGNGPVGQARTLANFMLHSGLVRHPFSGVEIESSGAIVLPIPDAPSRPISHWYLLTWSQRRDGLALAEELWQTIQSFVDELIEAFERSVPKRLRRVG